MYRTCLLVAFCALLAACAPAPPDARPNVVLVVVDQLRKDSADAHLAGVNALARRGVVFEQMRSTAPWTYPAVVSLLSGLYPQQHGADGHPSEQLLSRIDPELPLLQKRLRAEGYATAAFVTNPFLLDWNAFHLGFDRFDGSFVGSEGNRVGDESVWRPSTMYAGSVNEALRAHFDATPPTAPEFTYVHYIDVHGPWRDAPFRPDYEAAVRYVDRKILEVYDYLLERYDGRVLFVVTSDHGRALGDDERVGEGRRWRREKRTVHDFNVRVPFAILPSAIVTEPRVIEGPASHVDVVPTLLDWLGLEPDAQRPGISLLAAIRGEADLDPARPTYARQTAFGHHNDGVVREGRKLIRYFDPQGDEVTASRVFDLAADPRETRALEGDFAAETAELAVSAGDHGLAYDAQFDSVEPGVEQRLRELGYLQDEE